MATWYLDLPIKNGRRMSINYDDFNDIKDELELFLEEEDYMNSRKFAKSVLFLQEIKSNNTIEGITDDLIVIEKAISDASSIKNIKQRRRIINLYNGYKYILTHKTIDEKHFKELYGILSDGLLEKSDIAKMGDLYREDKVYILKNGRLDIEPDQGLPFDLVPEYMKIYFDYVNGNMNSDSTMTDYFIKSQIMHFYFVYIHPYFDVNGRTSRTMDMWYLLKKQAYPYIIFNRGISFKGSKYDRVIKDAKESCDITYFLEMMLDTLKLELEKEHIMQDIASSCKHKLSGVDFQTLLYFLTMNGSKTLADFGVIYNRFNDKKTTNEIYMEMIEPLIDMEIFKVIRQTKRIIGNIPNVELELNPTFFENDEKHLSRIKLK